jgi:hypothetical protein
MLEAQHEVVGIPHEEYLSPGIPPSPVMSPRVQDIMEVEVGQQGRDRRALRSARLDRFPSVLLDDSSLEPLADQPQQALIRDPMLEELHHPFVADVVEEATNVCVQHPVHFPSSDAHRKSVECLMRSTPRPKPIGKPQEVRLIDGVEDLNNGPLDDFVLQGCDAKRPQASIGLRDVNPSTRLCPVTPTMDSAAQLLEVSSHVFTVPLPHNSIDSRRSLRLKASERPKQTVLVEMM